MVGYNVQMEIKVYSPHDRSHVDTLPLHSRQEVLSCLETAHKLYLDRDNWLAKSKRIAIMERLVELMQDKKTKEELISIAIKEGGKPHRDTVVEVDRAIQGIKLGIQAVHNLHGEEVPMGLTAASGNRLACSFMEPIGVVVSLSAFNHPLNLIVHQTIPALAAGCPVVVKPAEATPRSCFKFVELLHKAGLPKEWCQAVLCANEDAEALATDRRVAYLSFIGSAKVGWYLRSKLAPGARCALEHGGVAPVIIDRSADIDELVEPLAKGAFYHAGQVCVSTKRIYVPNNMAGEFAEKLARRAQRLLVGDPSSPDTEVGPLIRPAEVTRVKEWVDEAIRGGAKLLCGGKADGECYFEPTVLLNPPADAKVSTLEIFGPVVCIYGYDAMEEAIADANRLPVSFQAAVFSRDIDMAMKAVRRLHATTVMVNDHTAFRVDWMPFGGALQSGIGVGGIGHSAREMSQEKLMVLKSSELA